MLKKFLLIGVTASTLVNGEPMKKLVNTQNGFVVIEFNDGKPTIHDRFFEQEMLHSGIPVPPKFTATFEGKKFIFPDDPLFEKAFREIYYPLYIADPAYQWTSE